MNFPAELRLRKDRSCTIRAAPPSGRICAPPHYPDYVRVDIVTIFPEFFNVLDVSLLGRARQQQLLDIRVHDLRDFTHDRHRTVDDTPAGGGGRA